MDNVYLLIIKTLYWR